ncbi:gamma-glutamyltransferase [Phenylobacterium sp.]|uniref:gamma-glutamyltransferase n=1 Tax=Phenylobacterium sp. TaxID=1871053 RepID=UPI002731A919|nr:gamma-glutamyltransferase [Phenylobacterium sp.]MDP1875546.1 gamma-glutamyltransferase [Phenylobacterium sp.]
MFKQAPGSEGESSMMFSRRRALMAAGAWSCAVGAAAAETRPNLAFLPAKRPPYGHARSNRDFSASSNHPAATEAARRVRLQGGGVLDMYLAALATAWVVDPANCSPFGRMQGVYSTGGGYDCLYAPTGIRDEPGSTVPVPGNIAAYFALRQSGRLQLPLSTILAPARSIAVGGFRPSSGLSAAAQASAADLQPDFRRIYLDDRGGVRARVRNPQLSQLLEVLGRASDERAFWTELYQHRPGPWALETLLDNSPRSGPPRDLEVLGRDGRRYRLRTTANLETWGPWTLLGAAVISHLQVAGAITDLETAMEAYLLATILVLDRIPFSVGLLLPKSASPSVDIDVEAEGRAIAARVGQLLRATPAELWAELAGTYFPGEGSKTDDRNTNAFAIASDGDLLSFTTSLGPWFGSKRAWFGAGLAYSYAMKSRRLFEGQTHDVTEMSPLIIERDGSPWLAIGAAGSERIYGALTYMLFLKLSLGLSGDMADLMMTPRLFPKDGKVRIHRDMPQGVQRHLAARGFVLEATDYDSRKHLGIVNLVERVSEGVYRSGADPSSSGGAL